MLFFSDALLFPQKGVYILLYVLVFCFIKVLGFMFLTVKSR